LKHTGGEVWGLNPNPEQPNIFLSTYGEKEKTTWKKKCAIWSIPQNRVSLISMISINPPCKVGIV